MELTTFLIFGLATWRLSSLLVNEAGPGDIFLKLRERVGFSHDESKNKLIIPGGFYGDLFSCIWCCSLWVGAGWIAFYILAPAIAFYTGAVFALSAAAVLVQGCVQ